MSYRLLTALALAALPGGSRLEAQHPSAGHPDPRDLQGTWTNGTATPLTRQAGFVDRAFFTEAEAAEFERTLLERFITSLDPEDQIAADLNEIYPDRLMLLADRRTSLIVDPPNGLLPALRPQARARAALRPKRSYDGPEALTLDERCLLETAAESSNAAPPMVPNFFGQNIYQIVQTPEYVAIATKVVHDTRLIRMGGEHLAPATKGTTRSRTRCVARGRRNENGNSPPARCGYRAAAQRPGVPGLAGTCGAAVTAPLLAS